MNLAGFLPVNGVSWNILRHHGIGGDDCAVADLHAGHNDALAPDPHVVSDDRVALARKLRHVRRGIFRPGAAEDVERVRRGTADAMVCRAHDELRAGRNLTELPDHEMVAELRIVEQHIVPLKPRRIDRIVIIGVVTDRDIRRVTTFLMKQEVLYSFGKTAFGSGIFIIILSFLAVFPSQNS